ESEATDCRKENQSDVEEQNPRLGQQPFFQGELSNFVTRQQPRKVDSLRHYYQRDRDQHQNASPGQNGPRGPSGSRRESEQRKLHGKDVRHEKQAVLLGRVRRDQTGQQTARPKVRESPPFKISNPD